MPEMREGYSLIETPNPKLKVPMRKGTGSDAGRDNLCHGGTNLSGCAEGGYGFQKMRLRNFLSGK
jgi:hypothetical protein